MIPDFFPPWDGELLLFLQETTRNDVLDTIFPLLTKAGDLGLIWIALGLALLLFRKTRVTGVLLLLSLALAHVLNTLVLKELFGRQRPFEALEGVRLLITPPGEASFPSGHAATAFASSVVLIYRERGLLRWLPCLLAILIAFSRIYVGVHYPLDVLGGAIVGTLIALLVSILAKTIISHFTKRKISLHR